MQKWALTNTEGPWHCCPVILSMVLSQVSDNFLTHRHSSVSVDLYVALFSDTLSCKLSLSLSPWTFSSISSTWDVYQAPPGFTFSVLKPGHLSIQQAETIVGLTFFFFFFPQESIFFIAWMTTILKTVFSYILSGLFGWKDKFYSNSLVKISYWIPLKILLVLLQSLLKRIFKTGIKKTFFPYKLSLY